MNKEKLGGWYPFFKLELLQDYMVKLKSSLNKEYENYNVTPTKDKIFNPYIHSDPEKVRVVIIDNSPYSDSLYNTGFGLNHSSKKPLSRTLDKIYKTLNNQMSFGRYLDIGAGNHTLSYLIKQDVLLLNSKFTIREGDVNSHNDLGWEKFVVNSLYELSSRRSQVCYIAFGNKAKKILKQLHSVKSIQENNYFLSCEHPYIAALEGREWKNKDCFNKINKYLEETNQEKIIW